MCPLFQNILLYMLYKMEHDRTLLAPFYILQGKPSIQTIQDANLYQLNRFFGLYKRISKSDYVEQIDFFSKEQWIVQTDGSYRFTQAGRNQVSSLKNYIQHLQVDGKRWHKVSEQFYFRFLLLIQVWTNRKAAIKHYVPIIEHKEVENWIKYVYAQTRHDVTSYLNRLYEELTDVLEDFNEQSIIIFIQTITNAEEIGRTNQQLQRQFHLTKEDVDLTITEVIHYILTQYEREKHPILTQIARIETTDKQLTSSAQQTKDLLEQGYDVENIARIRRLKENTIQDHIVEIALHADSFPYEQYVHEDYIREIAHTVDRLKTFKLKDIKQAVNEAITYFQIRLVLTRLQKEGE